MLKKVVVLVLVLGGIVLPGPARAADNVQPPGVEFVFPVAATTPCSAALTVDVCAYNAPANTLGYKACENPFPPGSYYDIVTQPAPTPPGGKKMILRMRAVPTIDWDTWICGYLSGGGHNGGEFAQGANVLGSLCDNSLGADNPIPIGCIEISEAPAEAGKRYVLRAYNYFDIADCPAHYNWVFV